MTAAPAASPVSGTPVLDPSVIDSLSAIMQADEIRSLLVDMKHDVSIRLARLAATQIAGPSLDGIARDAHDLKSMGGNFGLTEMSARAGTVERAARSGCVETVRVSVPPLLSAGRESLAALSRRYEIPGGRMS